MKSRQFCSVCKQWLDMEVVPTGDGDDDGVVWFRCPQCQGFLPKLSSSGTAADDGPAEGSDAAVDDGDQLADAVASGEPVEGLADIAIDDIAIGVDADEDVDEDDDDDEDDGTDEPGGARGRGRSRTRDKAEPAGADEPVLEYAAMLAAVDPATAVPYRPWEAYEVGQCVLHLAWDDCGVVVAKEALPGGRQVIKCWFQDAGVVRLIENAPR